MPFRLSPRTRSTAWIHSAKHTTASPSVRDQITNEARTFPPGLSYILCPRSTVPVGAIHGRPTFLRIRTTHHPLSTSHLPRCCCTTLKNWPRLATLQSYCQLFLSVLRGYPSKLPLHARALAGRTGDFCSFPFLQAEIDRGFFPTIEALILIDWHCSFLPSATTASLSQ